MTTTNESVTRKKLYTLLRVGKSELGLDEDVYRDLLERYGATVKRGAISASTMTIAQLESTLAHMKSSGFRPRRSNRKKQFTAGWRDPRIDKCIAIWRSMHELGITHNASMVGLDRFAHKSTGVAKLEWAQSHQLNDVIERMKQWAGRQGFKYDNKTGRFVGHD